MKELLYNARIVTIDRNDQLQRYSWLVYDTGTGRVIDIGNGDSPDIENAIDLGQNWVFPGLHDAHLHVQHHGTQLRVLNLRGCSSKEEFSKAIKDRIVEELRAFKSENAPRHNGIPVLSITGGNWEDDILGFLPCKQDIDVICDEVKATLDFKLCLPVFIPRACHHIMVMNSDGLDFLSISDETAAKYNSDDSLGGTFDLDQNGHITGVLREHAMRIFTIHQEKALTDETSELDIRTGLEDCARKGVTMVHSCEQYGWNAWNKVYNDASSRVPRAQLSYYYPYFSKNTDLVKRIAPTDHSRQSVIRIKIFTDGALGAQTAALSEPYANCKCRHKPNGIAMEDTSTLKEKIENIYNHGFGCEIHVIGDYAAEMSIDAVEAMEHVRKEKALPAPILIHCQLLSQASIERMAALGIHASVQPAFVPTDCRWLDNYLTKEYQEKTQMYPWKSLLEKGIIVGGSSDAPVEDPNPFTGMYDAIVRPDSHDRIDSATKTFRERECLSFTEALRIYTTEAAKMVKCGTGRLEVESPADFVILESSDCDADCTEEPGALLGMTVCRTVVAGKTIFAK